MKQVEGEKYPNHSLQKCPQKNLRRLINAKAPCVLGSPRTSQKGVWGAYCSVFPVFPSYFPELKVIDLGQRQAAEQAGLCSDLTELVLYSYDSKESQRVQATVTQSCFISGG